jgi:hypothetical protein
MSIFTFSANRACVHPALCRYPLIFSPMIFLSVMAVPTELFYMPLGIYHLKSNSFNVPDHVNKLEHLLILKDKGALSEEEFEAEKIKILANRDSLLHNLSEAVKPTQKNENFRTFLFIFLGIAVVAIIIAKVNGGFGISKKEGVPSYVKDVVALKEGSDGLQIYFILADNSGSMISSAGTVRLTITNVSTTLLDITLPTTTSDFEATEVGRGAYKHDVLLYSFGRIPYSKFRAHPSENTGGDITIEFIYNGNSISGKTNVFF